MFIAIHGCYIATSFHEWQSHYPDMDLIQFWAWCHNWGFLIDQISDYFTPELNPLALPRNGRLSFALALCLLPTQ